ncbi:Ribosomal protein L7/L30 like protein [Aduncisulcus paluster]|uniref:Ribosomal protein L7/L30 like protein n=1 Tax=Aduncisulcus paluster TaxID=2918883 RepID=A0ABQ5KL71_9EUKA|nr:Ribosomal protein L7/L30 like protein [Aduncisulcus paluster]|eukprot:gnl/Carplike_NY0171/1861_a2527_908.p1 GENE.gnl/Carplike_NY0171/1861_a2527_908~~gnl/Carplike_NY0171/1861_a2527_908.p1  ORF type:complete len:251 (-),score=38.09 gnl/Carplike_NY0171/1861_a2527_908:301-1053(-)
MEAHPEVVLKRRKALQHKITSKLASRKRNQKSKGTGRKSKKTEKILIPEQIIRKTMMKKYDAAACSIRQRSNKPFVVPDDAKLIFAMRIRRSRHMTAQVKQALRGLGLLVGPGYGVFLQVTKDNLSLLRAAESYIVWGWPSLKLVRELMEKRATVRLDKGEELLTDNVMIEKAFGEKYGYVCIDDLVHVIYNVGEGFDDIIKKFLKPFCVCESGRATKLDLSHKFDESIPKRGGFGFRGVEVNTFVLGLL